MRALVNNDINNNDCIYRALNCANNCKYKNTYDMHNNKTHVIERTRTGEATKKKLDLEMETGVKGGWGERAGVKRVGMEKTNKKEGMKDTDRGMNVTLSRRSTCD